MRTCTLAYGAEATRSMKARRATHPSVADRREAGRRARARAPRSAHAGWRAAGDRPDPVALIEAQNQTREPDLVPVRHGRMIASPFAFFRGAARVMAADLRHVPRAGLEVQLCGDAHIANFGVYASPERALLFDLNDFDETLPGPFEYDVARLAASVVVAGRDNGFGARNNAEAARAAVATYRAAMAAFAAMPTLEVWYSRVDALAWLDTALPSGAKLARAAAERARRRLGRARARNSAQAAARLTEVVDGARRFVRDPPLLVPSRDILAAARRAQTPVGDAIAALLRAYTASLPNAQRRLLERFEFVDFARRAGGIGSVGTRTWIALFRGRDDDDPLMLQLKEATASVLEDHLPASAFREPGERVVQGQRLMQAASDIFLGWARGVEARRFYYWRQLRDMKTAVTIERLDPASLAWYGGVCGWTLARAHARSGDPVAIAAYLGSSDRFDRAMTDFAARYADQTERDHRAFVRAVRSGRLAALAGV